MTYAEVRNLWLHRRQSLNYRTIQGIRSTRIVRECYPTTTGYEYAYAVQYHGTSVAVFFPDGRVRLNTGGHQTATTKQRINRFTSARIVQRNFRWIVQSPTLPVQPFYDGIELPIIRPAEYQPNLFD